MRNVEERKTEERKTEKREAEERKTAEKEKRKNRMMALNPITKLYLMILLAIVSVLFDWKWAVGTVAVTIVFAKAAGKLSEFLRMWLKTIVLVSAFVFCMQALFLPGTDIWWRFWIFSVKGEGVRRAISLCSRILGAGTAIVLGIRLIDVDDLVISLEHRGVSPAATYVIRSTVNIIPQMNKKMIAIMDAQRSRGVETESNLWVRAKAFFPTVGPLILNSIVSTEERAITLEARAFSAKVPKTRLRQVADGLADRRLRTVFVCLLVLAAAGRVVLWIV